MKLAFATLDVFSEKRFAGNPLAVVFDADKVEAETMQAIAREFGYPETVFVLKPDSFTSTARLASEGAMEWATARPVTLDRKSVV